MVKTDLKGDTLTLTSTGFGLTKVNVMAVYAGLDPVNATFAVMSRDDSRDVDLYPNPVASRLNIRMGQGDRGRALVKIMNSAGRECLRWYVTLDPFVPVELNVGRLTAGNYIVTVDTGQRTVSGKILKL